MSHRVGVRDRCCRDRTSLSFARAVMGYGEFNGMCALQSVALLAYMCNTVNTKASSHIGEYPGHVRHQIA